MDTEHLKERGETGPDASAAEPCDCVGWIAADAAGRRKPVATEDHERTAETLEVSEALHAFMSARSESLSFFGFLTGLVLHTDLAAHVAREVLAHRPHPQISPEDLAKKEPGEATKRLRRSSQLLLEMLLTRAVDNFLTYLGGAIRLALVAKPEMLRSSDTIRLVDALRFGSMPELVADLADRKVMRLTYGGFVDLTDWCERQMGLQLADETSAKALVEIIETRNVIVHSRGSVGPKYVRTVKGSGFADGDYRKLDVHYFEAAENALADCAMEFDQRLIAKFALAAKTYERNRCSRCGTARMRHRTASESAARCGCHEDPACTSSEDKTVPSPEHTDDACKR